MLLRLNNFIGPIEYKFEFLVGRKARMTLTDKHLKSFLSGNTILPKDLTEFYLKYGCDQYYIPAISCQGHIKGVSFKSYPYGLMYFDIDHYKIHTRNACKTRTRIRYKSYSVDHIKDWITILHLMKIHLNGKIKKDKCYT